MIEQEEDITPMPRRPPPRKIPGPVKAEMQVILDKVSFPREMNPTLFRIANTLCLFLVIFVRADVHRNENGGSLVIR